MELICPICNGLVVYLFKCPICGKQMKNTGRVQGFLDEYSPYLSMEMTDLVDGVGADQCVHLFYCSHCDNDKRIPIEKVKM